MKNINIGLFLVSGVILILIKVFILGLEENLLFSDMKAVDQGIIVWGFSGAFIIWIWMMADYFENRPIRMNKTWGFLLFFGSYVVASIYFLVIYIPRARNTNRRK